MEAPSICAQHVEQLFVPLIHLVHLVELSRKYSTSLSSPHMTLASVPIEYDSDLNAMWCHFTIC
jgi:hypothetical protein